MRISFLGLGIMGSRMAANLLKSGDEVTVWNRTPEKAADLVAKGAKLAATPFEAAQSADIIFTMLSTPEVVAETALGVDGFLPGLETDSLWVDCSTVNPAFSRQMSQTASICGARFLDAPVAGSKDPAGSGKLIFLVGGEAADVETARPYFNLMGSRVVHVGAVGMGSALKIVNNLMSAVAVLAFSEGLVLGEALGIDRAMMFDYFSGGPIIAPIAASKRAKIESGDFTADFPLQWAQKDLHLAALTAYEQGVSLPAGNLAKEIYRLAARQGLAEADFSAVYQFLKEDKE